MAYEDKIRGYVWARPVCGLATDIVRVAGEWLPSRNFSDPSAIAELATMLTHLVREHPGTSLHLNMYPPQSAKFGIYLDLDPTFHTSAAPIAMERTREELDDAMRRIASGFVKQYVANLIRAHVENVPADANAIEFKFQALYAGRPRLEELPKDADGFRYKYGCHLYIGEIQALQPDHQIAFEKAVSYFVSAATSGSEVFRLLRDRFGIPSGQIAKVFDPNIVMSRNILLPGCRKMKGHVTYAPTHIISYTLAVTEGVPHVFESGVKRYSGESLLRFFPVHIGKDAFPIASAYAQNPVELPAPVDAEVEEQAMFEEARHRNNSVSHLFALLKLLPPDRCADKASGHEFRLKITNAVVHEIRPAEDRGEWAGRILRWFYSRGSPVHGVDWNKPAHIDERIEEAIRDGQHSGIGWIRKLASDVDAAAVHKIDELFRSHKVVDFLQRLHAYHSKQGGRKLSAINHQEAGSLIYRIIGENYRALLGTSARDREWYRYTDDPKPHYSCKKWRRVTDINTMLMYDIKNTVNPILAGIVRECQRGSIAMITATSTPFDQYVMDVRDTLGNSNFITGLVSQLAAEYVFSGSEFGKDLDMLPDLTGCLNGVLKFSQNPFRVELLNGDNRDLPVSRSVDACYRTDIDDGSPYVARVWKILRSIVPNEGELDYILTVASGVIFSGRCGGEKLFILYGSGGDGKSTLMNALVALAGRNSQSGFRGYGAEGDPRIFQHDKKDANSHDAGSIHLYGGVRIGNFAEPSGTHPYIVESAVKSKLSGSATYARGLFEAAQSREFRVVPFILTNDQLEFRGPVTVGGERRINCWLFTVKFKPLSEMARYAGKPGFHPIDPSLLGAFGRGSEGRELREALMHILIHTYLPVFYDKYNGDITAIPLPPRYDTMTSNFFGRHSNVVAAFTAAKMEQDAASAMPMADFLNAFTAWHRITQRGSIRDLYQKKRAARGGTSDAIGPATRDPWTHEVLHILSSSPLGSDMVYKEGDTLRAIGPNEIIMVNTANLFIGGWRLKQAPQSAAKDTREAQAEKAPPDAADPAPAP